ncbi:MAG: hypothetical protein ABJB47_06515 [Actinomycetota bacterium]
MRIAAVTAAAGLFLAPVAGAASAATHTTPKALHIVRGTTHVVTVPGIAGALLSHGIVPIATAPATGSLLGGGAAVKFNFPVTGGSVGVLPPRGHINHRGGILFFADVHHTVLLRNFVINLRPRTLTAIATIPGKGSHRVAVFRLDLSHAVIHHSFTSVRVANIGLKLTAPAAGVLDAVLRTDVFTPGMKVAVASTSLHL